MRIKDDVGTGIGLCALTQTIGCTFASGTSAKAVIGRCRIPANRRDSRGRRSCCAVARGGCAAATAGAHGLIVDGQIGVAAVRAAGACIEAFPGVQPAGACARERVAGVEDDKVAGGVGIAIVPAEGFAVTGDGEIGTWCRIAAETGDEGGCAARCRGGGSWYCFSKDW